VKQVEAGLYHRRRASDAVRLEVAADLDPRIRDCSCASCGSSATRCTSRPVCSI
jgi:hypothetical protein